MVLHGPLQFAIASTLAQVASGLAALPSPFSITLAASVPVPPDVAYNTFVDYVWRKGGGLPLPPPIVLIDGGEYGVGFTRLIVPPFLMEQITSGTYPSELVYRVTNPGYLTYPVSAHEGRIIFEPAEGRTITIVKWNVKATPLPGCGPLVRWFTELIVGTCMENYKNQCCFTKVSDFTRQLDE